MEELNLSDTDELKTTIGSNPVLHGLKGPSFSQVITSEPGAWISLELIIHKEQLLNCVTELRNMGGISITTSDVGMIFYKDSIGFSKLETAISIFGDQKMKILMGKKATQDYLNKIRTNSYSSISSDGNGYFSKTYELEQYIGKIIELTKKKGDDFLVEISSKIDGVPFGGIKVQKNILDESVSQISNKEKRLF